MTDLERGPSSEQGPSMRVEPLLNKSPDPHSIVERLKTELLKWWSFDDYQRHTHTWHTRTDFIFTELPKILAEYESSLSRIKSETVELRQNYVDANEGRLDAIALLTRVHQLGATSAWRRMPDGNSFNATPLGQDIASAIRSSLTNGGSGAEKTAESNHSPSTLNAETE